jgi:hypothetical protein
LHSSEIIVDTIYILIPFCVSKNFIFLSFEFGNILNNCYGNDIFMFLVVEKQWLESKNPITV